jgi:hypothetical protein
MDCICLIRMIRIQDSVKSIAQDVKSCIAFKCPVEIQMFSPLDLCRYHRAAGDPHLQQVCGGKVLGLTAGLETLETAQHCTDNSQKLYRTLYRLSPACSSSKHYGGRNDSNRFKGGHELILG